MPDIEAPQDALFEIEGPDEDGCVWACSADGRDDWCQNLGPKEKVHEVLIGWLTSVYATPISVHLIPQELSRLDAWIAEQKDGPLTRPDAVKRLLNLPLA